MNKRRYHFIFINIGQASRSRFLKLAAALVVAAAVLLCWETSASAEEADAEQGIIEQQLQNTEVQKLEEEINKYSSNILSEIIPGYDTKKIIEDASKGKLQINIINILNRLLNRLFKELYQNIHILAKLIALSLRNDVCRF
jgi:stage III sporulation protein AE